MPGLPRQGVVLEYSTNLTQNYRILGTYDPPDFYGWTFVSLPIPMEARLPLAYFRWRQWTTTLAGFHNWALDDTLIAQELPLPVVTAQPTDQRVNVGATATFPVVASGLPPLL